MVNNQRISFGGLASGIDTNSIIDQLMAIARRPITLQENRKAIEQQRIDAFGTLSTSLGNLLTKLTTLKDADSFRARATTVLAKDTDTNKITATATSGAATGSLTFNVTQLATSTTAESASAVGAAIDAGVPLDQAGFSGALQTGSFTINGTAFTIDAATATNIVSASSIGAGFSQTSALDASGSTIAIAGGTFTVNGVSVNYSAADDSLDDVIGYINGSTAGVTASYSDATKSLTLTHDTPGSGQTITLADTSGNFLEAMNLIDGVGTKIGTETAGTDVKSLTDVINDINGAAIGVTASLVNDAGARPNLLQLTSGSTVQLGSSGDTSNFLSLTSLLESPPGTTRTSQHGLGGVQVSENLEDARLDTALAQGTGTFTINGVDFAWDATSESMSNIITRINQSSANVTATYDAFNDVIRLTNDQTGALGITLGDTDGNFLAATGLLAATQDMGQSMAYSVDGGATRYSTSNTVTDVVPGLTLTAVDTTTQAVTITVKLQSSTASSAVDGFVTQYNSTMSLLRDATKYVEDGPNGVLFGDGTVRRMQEQLRSLITQSVPGLAGGLRSLSDVGLTFGAVGSQVGTTNTLVFDSQKFLTKLQADPEAVAQLFTVFDPSASLVAGGTGSIASIAGTPTSLTKSGRYRIDSDAGGNLIATFTPNDGSAATVTNGTITAGGTNTTLIPGLTLTALGALQSGTDEITVSALREGRGKAMHEFVESLTRVGGVITTRTDEGNAIVADIDDQIAAMELRLEAKEDGLVRKFTQMELTISRLQQQQQALTQMQSQLGAKK